MVHFTYSFSDSQKKKATGWLVVTSILFVITIILVPILLEILPLDGKIFAWFPMELVTMVHVAMIFFWLDRKTWQITQKENGISFRNRLFHNKEVTICDIQKVSVNQYGRVQVYGEENKKFLTRNVFEYPGMVDLMLLLKESGCVYVFSNQEMEESFWNVMRTYKKEFNCRGGKL